MRLDKMILPLTRCLGLELYNEEISNKERFPLICIYVLTEVPVESMLERWPFKGCLGLVKLNLFDLLSMQGVANPPAKRTNSISVLKLTT